MYRILLMGLIAFGLTTASLPAHALAPVAPVGPADLVLGPAKAPVTVIEYASLTCPHCGRWENEVFPEVKKKLIDTGKIRYVFRDFPLDGTALKAAQLAHCEPSQYLDFIEVLFQSQRSWVLASDPIAELGKIGKLGGVSDDKFKACLADKKLQDSIVASRQRAEASGVDSTPTFFFNGKPHAGELSYDAFLKLVQDAAS